MSHSPNGGPVGPSPSNIDRDILNDIKPSLRDSVEVSTPGGPGDARVNSKKRASPSGDTVDYPRRRATIAVRYSHHELIDLW